MSSSLALLEMIFRETLNECAPERLVFDRLEPRDGDRGFAIPGSRFDVKLPSAGKLWLFGAGKASARMAAGVAAKLGPQLHGGAVIVPEGTPCPEGFPDKVELLRGTHPDPGAASVAATGRLLELASQCAPDEHAIFVLSGGASALLTKPARGLPIELKARIAHELMSAGAPISELNVVRKHLSQVKGGRLAGHFKCGVTVLVLSDVAGNFLDTIGSGPFEADRSTCAEALAILERRLGPARVAPQLRAVLTESLKEPAANVRHVLVGTGRDAAQAAGRIARAQGLVNTAVDVVAVEEPVDALVTAYARRVRQGARHGTELLVRYGEPVLTLPPGGPAPQARGGRSLQLALALARDLREAGRWTFLAGGTDGCDGNSGLAGAVVDGATWAAAEAAGLDPSKGLAAFDAGRVATGVGAALRTGPTGNNLQDLHLLLVGGL